MAPSDLPAPPPRHPLRDVLTSDVDPVDWITGVVTAVNTTDRPRTVRVRLADGTVTDPITYLGWWTPRVDDTAELLTKGPKMLALGPVAPANLDLPNPPAPVIATPPPAAPAAPPTTRTVPIQPVDAAYWSQWGWRTDDLIQGGPENRSWWWYGDAIAQAKGSGTIIAGAVYVERRATTHGVNGAATVRLGVHEQATRGGSGAAAHRAVDTRVGLRRGQGANIPLTGPQLAELNAGARGLGLEPGGSGYASPDYLRAVLGSASGALSLTVST